MTIKRKRIYEVALIACCCVIIALTAYMGITAIQKSMKLNLSFAANPIVFCQVLVNGEVVFDNSAKTIDNGVSLSGNVLTFNSAVSENVTLGENFNLQIKNFAETESAVVVSFSGATISESTTYSELVASGNSSAVLNVSTTTKMTMTFTKAIEVGLTLSAGVSIDAENSNLLQTTAGIYYLEQGEDLEAKIIVADGYQAPTYTINDGSQIAITDNTISINYNNLVNANGEVSLDVNVALPPSVNLTLNFSFDGDYSVSGWNYHVIVTDDIEFQMQYKEKRYWLGETTAEVLWTASFITGEYYAYDSKASNGFTWDEVTYTTAIFADKFPEGYNEYRYYTSQTPLANQQGKTYEIKLQDLRVGDKAYIIVNSYPNVNDHLTISSVTTSDVSYTKAGNRMILFEMPAKDVNMTIGGYYHEY